MKKILLITILALFTSACQNTYNNVSNEKFDEYKNNCQEEASSNKLTEKCFNQVDFNIYYSSDELNQFYLIKSDYLNDLEKYYIENTKNNSFVVAIFNRGNNTEKENDIRKVINHEFSDIKNEMKFMNDIYTVNFETVYEEKEKFFYIKINNFLAKENNAFLKSYAEMEDIWLVIATNKDHTVYLKYIGNKNFCEGIDINKHNPSCESKIQFK